MTVRNFTNDRTQGTDAVLLVSWSGLQNGDSGQPFIYTDMADRMIQVDGTFGAGGTLLIEGSIDGTQWTTMADNTGTALSVTGTKIRNLFDGPLYIRPRVSAGDGSTLLRCILLLRRQWLRPF